MGQSKEFCRLDELGYVSRGRSQHRPRNAPHLYGGEFPFIQTADITRSNLYISDYSQTYTQAGVDQSRMWEPGVLCIANAGVNTGDNAILSFKACFPDSVIGFIADSETCEVRYIKYFLDSVKSQIRSITMGATQDNLSVGKLLTIPIPKLPLVSQKKITTILSAYDDLIENNKRRIALLEKMAEEIYREWFVRFRFPGYQTAEFEKGIPKGWTAEKLGGIAKINARSLKKNNIPERIVYIDIGSVVTGRIIGVNEYGRNEAPGRAKRLVRSGDIIWSTVRPANKAYTLILKPKSNLVVSTGFAVISPDNFLHYPFIYQAVTTDSFVDQITAVAKGAAYPATSFEDFEKSNILMPDDSLLEKYYLIANPIYEQIFLLQSENNALENTKNLLLPRLISGKLSVENLDIQFPPSMQELDKAVE